MNWGFTHKAIQITNNLTLHKSDVRRVIKNFKMTFISIPKAIEVVNLGKSGYPEGILLSKIVLQAIEGILERNPILPKLGVLIRPSRRVN